MYIPAARASLHSPTLLERVREIYPTRLTNTQLEVDALVYEASTFLNNNSQSSDFDFYCNRANQSAAFLNALSLLSTFIPVLRPISSGGIRILSSPRVSALLLFTGAQALYQQAPHASVSLGRIFSGTQNPTWKDFLEVGSFAVGTLSTTIGLGSFIAGGRTYLHWRKQYQAEGVIPSKAHEMAWLRADGARRAFHDPQIWRQFAREYPHLSPTSRLLISHSAAWSNRILIGGSVLLGVSRLAFTTHEYQELSALGAQVSWRDWSALFMQCLLEFGPGMTVALYRGSRGDHRFGVGIPPSQTLSESVYKSPQLRVVVMERLRRAFAPLTPAEERAFLLQGENDLGKVDTLLSRAEKLELPQAQDPLPALAVADVSPAKGATLRLGLEDYTAWTASDFLEAFQAKRFSPSELMAEILKHSAMENGSLFPRDLRQGKLGRRIRRLIRESDRRYQEGNARPLEGLPIFVKDLVPGIDGVMQVGSKTARIIMPGSSPVVDILLEMGAIPLPVGMVASANGGWGGNAGYGYVPHPTRPGYDPAGSSSATAHLVGLKSMPVQIGIGSDTGGSIIAPAGAVGVFGIVPPQGIISTKNMAAFATFLDRIGVMSLHPSDGMRLASILTRRVADDPFMTHENPGRFFTPSASRPRVYFLTELYNKASEISQAHFIERMKRLHERGYEIVALNSDWNFLAMVPTLLYPFDAYPAAAFTHTNPLQGNFFDPPRISLDANMRVRMPKAALSIQHGFFDRARSLSGRYSSLIRRFFPEGSILASPSAEAILTADIVEGRAGARLDGHDDITMGKNRETTWGQASIPAHPNAEVGVAFSGTLPDLMRVMEDSGHLQ